MSGPTTTATSFSIKSIHRFLIVVLLLLLLSSNNNVVGFHQKNNNIFSQLLRFRQHNRISMSNIGEDESSDTSSNSKERKSDNNDDDNITNDMLFTDVRGRSAGVVIKDLNWRVEKLRLEEANKRRFLKSGPRFLPFNECRKWVQAWGERWESEEEWNNWIASGEKRNSYIPSRPEEYYTRTRQWISWFDKVAVPESILAETKLFNFSPEIECLPVNYTSVLMIYFQLNHLLRKIKWLQFLVQFIKVRRLPKDQPFVYVPIKFISAAPYYRLRLIRKMLGCCTKFFIPAPIPIFRIVKFDGRSFVAAGLIFTPSSNFGEYFIVNSVCNNAVLVGVTSSPVTVPNGPGHTGLSTNNAKLLVNNIVLG